MVLCDAYLVMIHFRDFNFDPHFNVSLRHINHHTLTCTMISLVESSRNARSFDRLFRKRNCAQTCSETNQFFELVGYNEHNKELEMISKERKEVEWEHACEESCIMMLFDVMWHKKKLPGMFGSLIWDWLTAPSGPLRATICFKNPHKTKYLCCFTISTSSANIIVGHLTSTGSIQVALSADLNILHTSTFMSEFCTQHCSCMHVWYRGGHSSFTHSHYHSSQIPQSG